MTPISAVINNSADGDGSWKKRALLIGLTGLGDRGLSEMFVSKGYVVCLVGGRHNREVELRARELSQLRRRCVHRPTIGLLPSLVGGDPSPHPPTGRTIATRQASGFST